MRSLSRPKAMSAERLQWLELAEQIAAVGHWCLALNTKELTWSDQMFRIHGLDPTGWPPSFDAAIRAFHPDDRGEAEKAMNRAIETGGSGQRNRC